VRYKGFLRLSGFFEKKIRILFEVQNTGEQFLQAVSEYPLNKKKRILSWRKTGAKKNISENS
jgi:hypothetical protein